MQINSQFAKNQVITRLYAKSVFLYVNLFYGLFYLMQCVDIFNIAFFYMI